MHVTRVAGAALALFVLMMSIARFDPAVSAQARLPYGPIPVDCNRACLEGLLDQYLAAVVAHDPKRLPLSADVKYTENDQVMDIGDGFWGTATGIGGYRLTVADPVSGQIGFIGSMREGNNPLLMSLRLRVQLGRITEVETTYFRQGGGGPNDIAGLDKAKPEPFWTATIPAGQRASRQQLIAVANAYFEGVQGNDGKGYYPFTDDCKRRENGALTANAPPNPKLPPGGFDAFALPCKQQLESGYYAVATRIHSRRYPVVDEERGIVFAYAMFDMAGTVRSITLTSGQVVSMANFNRPAGIEVTEAFKIENGLIRGIEMVGGSVPYHFTSAWEGGLSGR